MKTSLHSTINGQYPFNTHLPAQGLQAQPKQKIGTLVIEKRDNKLECPICFDEYEIKKMSKTECGHFFCKFCLKEHLKRKDNCPMCREPITHKKFTPLNQPAKGEWKSHSDYDSTHSTSGISEFKVNHYAASKNYAHTGRKTDLVANHGNLHFKGYSKDTDKYQNAFSNSDIHVEDVTISRLTHANFGSVTAKNSKLGDVRAHSSATLINTAADKVTAQFGDVTLLNNGEETVKVSQIVAKNNVTINNATVLNAIKSEFGTATVKNSDVGSLHAHGTINLYESTTAGNVQSDWSSVGAKHSRLNHITSYSFIKLTDVIANNVICKFGEVVAAQSRLQKVTAQENISLEDTKAINVTSKAGSIKISQPGGNRRKFTHINAYKEVYIQNANVKSLICGQKAILRDCKVETLILNLAKNSDGLLELNNSEVTKYLGVRVTQANIADNITQTFDGIVNFFTGTKPAHVNLHALNLFVKGTELPEIVFEGIDPDNVKVKHVDGGFLLVAVD